MRGEERRGRGEEKRRKEERKGEERSIIKDSCGSCSLLAQRVITSPSILQTKGSRAGKSRKTKTSRERKGELASQPDSINRPA